VITIPFEPRPLQKALVGLLAVCRFVVAVCHRRFGKTVLAVNWLIKCAVTCKKIRPRFAYIAPTYTQGKAVAWDYLKFYTSSIPGVKVNESELRVDFPNGAQIRIYGADNPDSLRGIYLDGAVLDEFGMMLAKVFSEVIRPLLVDREGWAFFIGTPNGKNQFYDIAQEAKRRSDAGDPGWAFAEYRASQTGVLNPAELAAARTVMTADEYDQEFECSFEASVKGAIFGRELRALRENGQLTRVPYDPGMRVDTAWDIGHSDATAIWFLQRLYTGEVRVIDYYSNSQFPLSHYVQVLNQKGYTYGTHLAPHDMAVKEFTTGHTRYEAALALGINFTISKRPQDKIDDAIHAARMLLPRCWFDAERCAQGIEALQNYRWMEPATKQPTGRSQPVHDWASHAADAFQVYAFNEYQPRRNPEQMGRREMAKAQRDYDPYDHRRPALTRGGY
jgi:phage terminase large subunit